jgi:kinesin family protein 5
MHLVIIAIFTNDMFQSKLELQYNTKKENQHREIEELRLELEKKSEDHAKLSTAMNDLKAANDQLQASTQALSFS